MASEDLDSKQVSVTKVIYRFFGGAALGAFIITIPISYGSPINLSVFQVGIASALIVLCGLLSSIWGKRFVDIVMRVLNGIGI